MFEMSMMSVFHARSARRRNSNKHLVPDREMAGGEKVTLSVVISRSRTFLSRDNSTGSTSTGSGVLPNLQFVAGAAAGGS